jgi:dTDP-4-dehydrorhamnose reductase
VKILLVGADGQVGFELQRSLAPLGTLVPTTRGGRLPGGASCRALDLSDFDSVRALVMDERPDWILNAAADTRVDEAERETERAFRINGHAVGALGAAAAAVGARVLHYSTDYVFAGRGDRPWRENDPTDPINAYGRSKLEGEAQLRAALPAHLVLRVAWVHAARGRNFLRTMLRLAGEREELRVVDDQIGAPTPARWIAEASAHAIARLGLAGGGDRRYGTWHLAPAGSTSWHGFASAIVARAAAAGLLTRAPRVVAVGSHEFPTPARRPAWSVLDTTALREAFGLALPDWSHGLDAVLGEIATARESAQGAS